MLLWPCRWLRTSGNQKLFSSLLGVGLAPLPLLAVFLSLIFSRRFPSTRSVLPLAPRLSTPPKLQITRSALSSLPWDVINIVSTSNRTNAGVDSCAFGTRSASSRQWTLSPSRLGSQKGRCARATPRDSLVGFHMCR